MGVGWDGVCEARGGERLGRLEEEESLSLRDRSLVLGDIRDVPGGPDGRARSAIKDGPSGDERKTSRRGDGEPGNMATGRRFLWRDG